MTVERGDQSANGAAVGARAGRFLGSLKDALLAASREERPAAAVAPMQANKPLLQVIELPAAKDPAKLVALPAPSAPAPAALPSAEEAARTLPAQRALERPADRPADRHVEFATPPTTRVVRREAPEKADRTQLVRGRQKIERQNFESDPVVGFLVVVGGPGLGAHRPVYEGNNTFGRTGQNRIPLDFGDDTISAEAQAYIRYDSADRSFLFVPNLAKTNVVSVNDKRPAGAVELKAMDVITLGRTQVAFLPFCGAEFDWSEFSESRE